VYWVAPSVRQGLARRLSIRATFNVPICTVTVQAGALRNRDHSGITSGALPEAEWQEWRAANGNSWMRASQPFDLLETLARGRPAAPRRRSM
jgi:hypothetical protein